VTRKKIPDTPQLGQGEREAKTFCSESRASDTDGQIHEAERLARMIALWIAVMAPRQCSRAISRSDSACALVHLITLSSVLSNSMIWGGSKSRRS
jgi:hypothetical protein